MRALKRLIAIAASLVVMAGVASPAIAGNESINLTLLTTEAGSFS
jgi:hypothetical protein